MNGVNFRYGKYMYMNGSCFSLSLVYQWGGVWGLQPHVRTQNHGSELPKKSLGSGAQNREGPMCGNTQFF